MKAFGIIAAIEAVLLALVVGLFLQSERHTSFPVSVRAPALSPQDARVTRVPVSFDIAATGVATTTAALTRGGAAAATPSSGDVGQVGIRTVSASPRLVGTVPPKPIRSNSHSGRVGGAP